MALLEKEDRIPLILARHRSFSRQNGYHNRIVSWPDGSVTLAQSNIARGAVGHPVHIINEYEAELVLAGNEANANAILDESSEKVIFGRWDAEEQPTSDRPLRWPLALICGFVLVNPQFYITDILGQEFDTAALSTALANSCGMVLPVDGESSVIVDDDDWAWVDGNIHAWMDGSQAEFIQQSETIGVPVPPIFQVP